MATASKIADVAQKTLTTGLILTTLFGIADVTRGFSVLVQRNIDRKRAHAEAIATYQSNQSSSSGSGSSEQ